MKDAGDGEHPQEVQGNRRPDREPAPPSPEDTKAAKVENDKRNTADEVDAIGLGPDGFGRFDGIVGIDPLNE